jgi:hypothetical protein
MFTATGCVFFRSLTIIGKRLMKTLTWPIKTVARVADVDSRILDQWFRTGMLQYRGDDKHSMGTGVRSGLSRPRVIEATIVRLLSRHGVPASRAVETKDSRLELLDNGQARKIKELRVLKSEGQRAVDPDALMQMMLDGKDIPAPENVVTQLTAEMLKWQAIGDARQSLKAPLAKARYEDSTAVLIGLKPEHDAVLIPALTRTTQAHRRHGHASV